METERVERILVYLTSGRLGWTGEPGPAPVLASLERIRAALRSRWPTGVDIQVWQADRGVEQLSVNGKDEGPLIDEVSAIVDAALRDR
jgi:hypothetical protein